MKLEDQVCSLDLAKRLKELGVKQESLFYWKQGNSDLFIGYRTISESAPTIASAFTVAELGEMLPEHIRLDSKDLPQYCFIVPGNMGSGLWTIEYSDYEEGTPTFTAETEADARAKMLIYLIENKLMEVKP